MALAGIAKAAVDTDLSADKTSVIQGEKIIFTEIVNVTDEVNCVIDTARLLVTTQGSSFECDLPTQYGNFQEWECGTQVIDILVSESNYGHCSGYGGDNVYDYQIAWNVPLGAALGIATANITIDVSSIIASNTVDFEITRKSEPPPHRTTTNPPTTVVPPSTTETTIVSTTTTVTTSSTTTTLESTTTTTLADLPTITTNPPSKPPGKKDGEDDDNGHMTRNGSRVTIKVGSTVTTIATKTTLKRDGEIAPPQLVLDSPRFTMRGDEVVLYVTEKGNPVKAEVTVIEPDGSKKSLETDENGKVKVVMRNVGRAQFIATKPDYEPASEDLIVLDLAELIFHPYSIVGLALLVAGIIGILWIRKRRMKIVVSQRFIESGGINKLLEQYKQAYVTLATFEKVGGEEYRGRIKPILLADKEYERVKDLIEYSGLDEENAEAVVLAEKINAKKLIVLEKDVESIVKVIKPEIKVEYPW